MLAKSILVHGVIGYKFCWLLPSKNHNQGIPAGHESAETPIGNELMVEVETNVCFALFHEMASSANKKTYLDVDFLESR